MVRFDVHPAIFVDLSTNKSPPVGFLFPQYLGPFYQMRIINAQYSSRAPGSQVLRHLEAECCELAEAIRWLAPEARQVRLSGILRKDPVLSVYNVLEGRSVPSASIGVQFENALARDQQERLSFIRPESEECFGRNERDDRYELD